MGKKFYVTTPIYYVNDLPHIGHAYTTVAADILARYHRLLGDDVFFLTGTDEHGQKVEKAARDKGRSPKEHADSMVKNFMELWKVLNISNDAFIRTTDPEHKGVVQELLQRLYDRGEIVKKQYRGWYCTPDERFWTEKEIQEGNCPDCGRPVEEIEEENYFFLMSKYGERLIEYIEKNPGYILPESRRNEVLGFLRAQPLGDLCISRPKKRLSWGIELPFDTNYVTYVWFDALINYFSATRYLSPGSYGEEWWPASHHIVGKDILTTHAVYWSTMLMALEMPLPENIFAHGWWTVDGRKMSKSLGNVIDPFKVAREYGVDQFRFFMFREVTFGLDGDFSESAIKGRINSDLANDLGNLLNRTLSMVMKYFGGKVPVAEDVDEQIAREAEGLKDRVGAHLKVLAFQKALSDIWSFISSLNKYIDDQKPWALFKDESKRGRLETVMYTLLEGLRHISVLIAPFMPESAERMASQLGLEGLLRPGILSRLRWGELEPGKTVRKGEALFPRIEEKKEDQKRMEQKMDNAKTDESALISIEDFAKVELRTARVLEAERVEGSSKLLRLVVDAGEKRQIVAGIGKAYMPDDLIGKTVVIVANLKPAKLMGIESQGMLLAVGEGKNIAILSPEKEMPPGKRVK